MLFRGYSRSRLSFASLREFFFCHLGSAPAAAGSCASFAQRCNRVDRDGAYRRDQAGQGRSERKYR